VDAGVSSTISCVRGARLYFSPGNDSDISDVRFRQDFQRCLFARIYLKFVPLLAHSVSTRQLGHNDRRTVFPGANFRKDELARHIRDRSIFACSVVDFDHGECDRAHSPDRTGVMRTARFNDQESTD
jgi:hypothetical protein